jgi:hypothetical protein
MIQLRRFLTRRSLALSVMTAGLLAVPVYAVMTRPALACGMGDDGGAPWNSNSNSNSNWNFNFNSNSNSNFNTNDNTNSNTNSVTITVNGVLRTDSAL